MIRVRQSDLPVGEALRWPVFDRQRKLLLRAGFLVESAAQVDMLVAKGVYRSPVDGAAEAAGASADAAAGDGREEAWRTIPFESLQLGLGTPLQLQRLDQVEDVTYATKLLGMIRGRSLIVAAPAPDGKLVVLRQGQPLLVRAFSGTDVFAFCATALSVRCSPDPYVHLSYPTTVDGTRVRREKRAKVGLIASATLGQQADGHPLSRPVAVTDLSAGGAALRTREVLGDVGSTIGLAFRLHTAAGEATLKLEAVIRTIVPNDDGRGPQHGVEFVRMQPLEALALSGYIARVEADEAKRANPPATSPGTGALALAR
jgi:c-di-GMP-binding flagellar brake protein YcgR